ncbi:MAG: isochorismatase family protein [Nitrospirae bacterium]|nr:isochorismatase family protein [Nitrospirota bacterium]
MLLQGRAHLERTCSAARRNRHSQAFLWGLLYYTPLETILRNLGRDTVIICGTLTNFCFGTTARQAYERGFKLRRRSYGKKRRQS